MARPPADPDQSSRVTKVASASPVQPFQNGMLYIICTYEVTLTGQMVQKSQQMHKRLAEPNGGEFPLLWFQKLKSRVSFTVF